ncbi:Restriction endonuclease FokI [Treponema sp. JC4]|uniref:restriction endonuclease FokI C-terminal domain-containing protein n=1 Tax=Treponema sp. JC4 TaxID=1124982 RepID=UPI00025B0B37|nr:Restriction endonuclease FokI [Treponema sp. JC4]
MKAYSGGYNLPIAQQDEMKLYISNNQKRDEKINSTKWWLEFPDYLKKNIILCL